MKGDVKGYPNVGYSAEMFATGSSYSTSRAKKVGYINIDNFRSYDCYTYNFYNKQTGKFLGKIHVEVDHKNGEHQDPPSPQKPWKDLLRRRSDEAMAIQHAIK